MAGPVRDKSIHPQQESGVGDMDKIELAITVDVGNEPACGLAHDVEIHWRLKGWFLPEGYPVSVSLGYQCVNSNSCGGPSYVDKIGHAITILISGMPVDNIGHGAKVVPSTLAGIDGDEVLQSPVRLAAGKQSGNRGGKFCNSYPHQVLAAVTIDIHGYPGLRVLEAAAGKNIQRTNGRREGALRLRLQPRSVAVGEQA